MSTCRIQKVGPREVNAIIIVGQLQRKMKRHPAFMIKFCTGKQLAEVRRWAQNERGSSLTVLFEQSCIHPRIEAAKFFKFLPNVMRSATGQQSKSHLVMGKCHEEWLCAQLQLEPLRCRYASAHASSGIQAPLPEKLENRENRAKMKKPTSAQSRPKGVG